MKKKATKSEARQQKLFKAAGEARKRVSGYTPAKKRALEKGAMDAVASANTAAKECMRDIRKRMAHAGAARNKKAFALRDAATILNDIHEKYPVTLAEALRVIEHLEDELAKKECKRSQEILDAIEKLRQPPLKKPEITEEMWREYEELFRKRREERERMPVPYWPHPHYPSPPQEVYPWWHPFSPMRVTCHT